MDQTRPRQYNVQKALAHIKEQLAKQQLVHDLIGKTHMSKQDLMQQLAHKQQTEALKREINHMHPADIAYVLENLSLDQRRLLWHLIEPAYTGAVLIEVSDAVRESLIADMDQSELLGAATKLDADEIADLVPDLPNDVIPHLFHKLAPDNRRQLETLLEFPEDTVGALMSFELIAIRDDVTLDVVIRYLRRLALLPEGLDSLPVVDRDGYLRGLLPLNALLINDGQEPVYRVMNKNPVRFHTNDSADEAANAFERYDLISAPVVNSHDQLVGLLKVDAALDHIQETAANDLLNQAGLKEEEDLFAPIWHSAKNRGLWLALNLLIAFAASRVIGAFEETIAQLVALAALMPVVAAMGGNTGNQTLALVIRAYALEQINDNSFMQLLSKESAIGFINGVVWGAAMGLLTLLLYGDTALAVIMLVAMILTLSFASLCGVYIPVLLQKMGQDPAYGSAIIVTGITDSLGFFIFLGLAAMFLI